MRRGQAKKKKGFVTEKKSSVPLSRSGADVLLSWGPRRQWQGIRDDRLLDIVYWTVCRAPADPLCDWLIYGSPAYRSANDRRAETTCSVIHGLSAREFQVLPLLMDSHEKEEFRSVPFGLVKDPEPLDMLNTREEDKILIAWVISRPPRLFGRHPGPSST